MHKITIKTINVKKVLLHQNMHDKTNIHLFLKKVVILICGDFYFESFVFILFLFVIIIIIVIIIIMITIIMIIIISFILTQYG